MYIHGFPGTNKKYNMIYPMIEIPCDNKNAFFFPNFLDIHATIGITKKVVPNAPKHPNRDTQIPLAPASPLKSLNTITKNVSAATVLKAL